VVLAGEAAIRHFEVFVSTQPQAFLVADASAFSEGLPRSGRSLRHRKTSRVRELEALTAADVALFSSSADVIWASSVRRPESCFLVPALFARAGIPPGFWSRENLLFVGSGESGESADENALAFLVERVLPLVKAGDPRLEFTVEAPVSAELRNRLEREAVRLLAPGGATNESFDRARLLIAPFPRRPPVSDFLLRAAVLGLPFVATPGAAAGLPFEDLPSDALARSARELADRVLALHRDEVRWTRLQRALRKMALRSLDAASVRETLVRAFASVGLAPPGPGVLIAAGPRARDRRR
jgi:glycosyltransferase involved in cell wall biosynthesis